MEVLPQFISLLFALKIIVCIVNIVEKRIEADVHIITHHWLSYTVITRYQCLLGELYLLHAKILRCSKEGSNSCGVMS
jgi:hypothetical protein